MYIYIYLKVCVCVCVCVDVCVDVSPLKVLMMVYNNDVIVLCV